jgi:hypothetical protein
LHLRHLTALRINQSIGNIMISYMTIQEEKTLDGLAKNP